MSLQVFDARPDASGGYKVDVSRGARVGRVSSEWFSRPDDERFLSLSDLQASVRLRAEHSRTRVVESAAIRVEAAREDAESLTLALPGGEAPVAPTHWSFGQLASLVGAPASYLRQLPAPLAAINLQYGLTTHRAEQVKTLETEDGRTELRAVTGPDYGRIYDHELVSAVMKIAGDGVGDTRWKIPGVLDWRTGVYNPNAAVSRESTTLYASDRDVFLFLVDDLNPIEAGKLPDGSPDLSVEVSTLSDDLWKQAGFRRFPGHRLAELVHQDEGRLVLHVEVTAELHRRHPFRGVHEQADRTEKVDKGKLVRGEDRPGCGAELMMAGGAFETTASLEVVKLKAAASRTNRRAARLRPAQFAEPPIRSLLAAGVNRPQRQRSRGRRKKEMLRHRSHKNLCSLYVLARSSASEIAKSNSRIKINRLRTIWCACCLRPNA
jgi:hypothetical protein